MAEKEGPLVQLSDTDIGVRLDVNATNLANKSDHVVIYCYKNLCNNGELDEMIVLYKKGELSQPIYKCRNLDYCFISPTAHYDVSTSPRTFNNRLLPLFSFIIIFILSQEYFSG